MSLQLPEKFKQDIQGKDTQLFPVVIISNYKEQAGGNFAFVGDKHFISTNVWTDPTFNNVYKPILLNIPSLKESLDVQSRKYKISSVSLDISNYRGEYNGERFSDSVTSSLINTEVRIFWVSPSVRRVVLYDQDQSDTDAAFQVFYGHIRKYEHDDEKVRLTVEDRSQIKLHKDLPLEENYVDTDDGLAPIPMVYGDVDKSPMVRDTKTENLWYDNNETSVLQTSNNYSNIIDNAGEHEILVYSDDYYYVPFKIKRKMLGHDEYLHPGIDNSSTIVNINEETKQYIKHSGYVRLENTTLFANDYLQCIYVGKPQSITIDGHNFGGKSTLIDGGMSANLLDINAASNFNGEYSENTLPPEVVKEIKNNLYTDIQAMFLNYDIEVINDPNESLPVLKYGININCVPKSSYVNGYILAVALNKKTIPLKTGETNGNWANTHLVIGYSTTSSDIVLTNWLNNSQAWDLVEEEPNINAYDFAHFPKVVWSDEVGDALAYQVAENEDKDIILIGNEDAILQQGLEPIGDTATIVDSDGLQGNSEYYGTNQTNRQFKRSEVVVYKDTDTMNIQIVPRSWQLASTSDENGNTVDGNPEYNIETKYNISEIDIATLFDLENARSKKYFGNVKGRQMPNAFEVLGESTSSLYYRNIGLILWDLFNNELNYNQEYSESFNPIVEYTSGTHEWNFDFTIADKINSKKLIENLSSIAPFVTRFDNMGNLKLNEIPQDGGTAEHTILESDVVDMNFTRTPIDEVYTKIEFKYNWDYATNEFTKRRILDMDNFVCWGYNNEGNYEAYNYDYYGFDYVTEDGEQIGSHKDTTLVVDDDRGKYIRDDATAERFCSWMLSWYGQQHLIIKLKLPLKYLNLEIGDIIDFNSLIGGIKPYGIDYTQDASGEENVVQQYQTFYKNFQIISTSKNLDFVEISAIQLHETWAVNANENGGVVDDVMVALNQGSNPGCSPLTGCMNINACNYNPDATAPSNCIFPEFWCEDLDGSGHGNFPPYPVCDDIYADTMPDGTLTKSEADQQGIINDCSDDCVGEYDCAGECGGSAEFDECGVCGGNNDCVDCAGVPNGDSFMDNCGLDCLPNEEPFHPDYFLDCAGLCPDDPDHNGLYDGGGLDECGVCNGEGNTCDVNLNYESQKLEYPELPPYFNTYPSNNDYFANCLDTYNPNCNAVNIEDRLIEEILTGILIPQSKLKPTFRISGNYLDGDNPAISGYFKYEIAITRTVYIGINDPVAQTSVCEEIYRKEATYNFNNISSEQVISFSTLDPEADLFKDANLSGGTSSVLDSSTEFFAQYQIFYEITEFVIESGYDVGNFNSVTFTNGGSEGVIVREFSFYHFPYNATTCDKSVGDVNGVNGFTQEDWNITYNGVVFNWTNSPAPFNESEAIEGTWNGSDFWWCAAAMAAPNSNELNFDDVIALYYMLNPPTSTASNTSTIKTSDVQLLYGNGECEIIGKDIISCNIAIENPIVVDDKTPEGYYVIGNNKNIGIMSAKQTNQFLNTLFEYEGELVIKNAFALNSAGERINCKIKRVMDYAELLNTNAEDMTTLSENLKSKKLYGKKINKTIFKQNIIDDLDASAGAFYLKDGSEYSGKFHIHIDTTQRMSGATHTEESENLYFKDSINGNVIDKLILANNSNYLNRQSMKLNSRSNTHRRKRTYATNS